MGLSKGQRAQLSSIQQMLDLSEWSDVKHGLVLLEAINDPQLWAHVSAGVSIQSSGQLQIDSGYLRRHVQTENQVNAALFVLAKQPAMATITTLILIISTTIQAKLTEPAPGREEPHLPHGAAAVSSRPWARPPRRVGAASSPRTPQPLLWPTCPSGRR